jgi:succinyl-CoA synthetase alpha subunit
MLNWNVVHKGVYYDSLRLMQLTRDLQVVDGVQRVAVMMGTPANQALMADAGLLTPTGAAASPNDLIIAIEASHMAAAQAGAQAAEAALSTPLLNAPLARTTHPPRTLRSALRILDGANLALISVPGLYAGLEAMKALQAGMHVMLFSNNVPLATEIDLKRLARAKGLLMLGPDCGTAIINGVPLGFANAVPRGRVGLAAASGTGLQEVSCLITAAGAGVSQAIGVGGRDLTDDIGGLMMAHALEILAADSDTEVIGVIGKPPGPSTWERLREQLAQLEKPCVAYFPGSRSDASSSWYTAATLEQTALDLVTLVRGGQPTPLACPLSWEEYERVIVEAMQAMHPDQRFVRGLYVGGTLAYEALGLLRAKLPKVFRGELQGVEGHSVIDLGEDQFTLGCPHPMIDGTRRREWILRAGEEPTTAVILLDVILGYGAHADPAGELLPSIQQITRQAQAQGRHVVTVASVCGTEEDPQPRSVQIDALRSHGVIVMPSNAQAARLAANIAAHLSGAG